MKAPNPRLAMLLSIGGVLVAGSAAALVNSQVLDGQSSGAPPTATAVSTTSIPTAVQLTTTPTVAPPPATSPPTTLPPSTAAPVVVTAPPTTTTTPIANTVPAAAGGTQATYRLGDAGTALLDTAGGRLTIVQVAPNPGWFVDRAESDGPASVEVRLESAQGEVRFEASLVRGVVRISLRTDDDDNSGSGSGNSGHGGGGGDDDNSGPGSDD